VENVLGGDLQEKSVKHGAAPTGFPNVKVRSGGGAQMAGETPRERGGAPGAGVSRNDTPRKLDRKNGGTGRRKVQGPPQKEKAGRREKRREVKGTVKQCWRRAGDVEGEKRGQRRGRFMRGTKSKKIGGGRGKGLGRPRGARRGGGRGGDGLVLFHRMRARGGGGKQKSSKVGTASKADDLQNEQASQGPFLNQNTGKSKKSAEIILPKSQRNKSKI